MERRREIKMKTKTKKKSNNKKVDTDVEQPKKFIMKFEFKDGIVFPREVELIKDCFKGNECFDPKEFRIEGDKLIVEGGFDSDKDFEHIFTNEGETIKWTTLLRYKVSEIFDYSGAVEEGGWDKEGDKICTFRFLDMKLKFYYWLKYLGELVSE